MDSLRLIHPTRLLIEAKIMESKKLESLMREADELLAITVASIKTAKKTK